MYQVIFNDKVVFESYTIEEAKSYCENHDWDRIHDTSYANYERACGIY